MQSNITTVGTQVKDAPNDSTNYSVQVLPDQAPRKLIERLRHLVDISWLTTSTGVLGFYDLESQLRSDPVIAQALGQFSLYRAGFRLFIRINSTQFNQGSILVTHWPMRAAYGQYRAQRGVLNPVTISASTQQSAEIRVAYPFPQSWLNTAGPAEGELSQSYFYCIEVLAPLRTASASATDTVTIQVFGAFEDSATIMNRDSLVAAAATAVKQSGPARDARDLLDGGPVDKVASSVYRAMDLVTRPIADTVKLADGFVELLGPMAGIFDKPEVAEAPSRVFATAHSDQFSSNAMTAAVSVGYSKDAYLRPAGKQGVELGAWSIAAYAGRPGLARLMSFTTGSPAVTLGILDCLADTPAGYLMKSFKLYRGSVRFLLQFFCSQFVSARFVLTIRRQVLGEYENFINQIIDVKGDTEKHVLIPFVHSNPWCPTDYPVAPTYVGPYLVQLELLTPIITSDATTDPFVDIALWGAMGADAQFALPVAEEWAPTETWPLPSLAKRAMRAKKQTSVISAFKKAPDPIVEGAKLMYDDGFAASDVPVTFGDLLQRYYRVPVAVPTNAILSSSNYADAPNPMRWVQCFLARRGGVRVKVQSSTFLSLYQYSAAEGLLGDSLPNDGGWHSLAFPWVATVPFTMKDIGITSALGMVVPAPSTLYWWSARDDLELGLPCLPFASSPAMARASLPKKKVERPAPDVEPDA